MKVLVVEDRPAELKLAHHVLTAEGHVVNDAGAAERALEMIREDRPDVVLLDLSLPGMDGLTLVRKLREDVATQDIRVVAVTSYPEAFPRDAALAAGCDAYLVKPLSTRTLPQTLTEVAQRP